MPHISYSELKDWKFCAHYHKLTRVNKIDGFKGNEYTAFGSAIHSVCEKKLLEEEMDNDGGLFPASDLVIDDLPYTELLFMDNDAISPYVIASFDIECDSSHGDFPLPNKDFQKLAIDIYDSLHRCHTSNVPTDTFILFIPIQFKHVHKSICG